MVPKYTKNLSKATKGFQKVNKGRFLNCNIFGRKKLISNVCWPFYHIGGIIWCENIPKIYQRSPKAVKRSIKAVF